ncbi:MAG TPA: PAS domain S-box protein, partial [Clostridia bacterium]|nr:PAS domain S-box protein [Clostridia bacterium]
DRAMAVGVVERAFQTFQPEEGEWRVVWPDGSVHWLVGRFQAFKDGAGKPLRLAGVNVDITDRKQAREELRQSEERFRTMADAIPQLAWIARADGHIFWFNRRCYEYTGATPEQLEGWGWRSVADPQVMPKVLEQWRGSIASGQPFSMEFPLRGADGQFRPFLTRVMPLKDNEGRVVLWFGTNTDITELKEAAEALRQSEERLRFALETSHTGAWDLDLADHTAFRSLEHDRIFGYAEPLPQWTYEVFLQHVLPEDRAAVDAKFRQATATLSVWSFECRIRRADGKVRRIWAAGRHRADAAGGMRRMAGIVQDITERKEAEEDLRRLKDELEVRVEQRTAELAAANRELNDFASIVAHDLKAPLRGVSTIARWVQTDYADKLDDKGRQRLAQMNQRVERMDRMIEEILEYSRLGRAEEKRELVALAKLVPLIVHDLAPPPHVRVRLAPGLPVVQGEPVRLRQVFQNLIANAIKYADKPEVDIGVDWTEIDSLWEFRVTDNGPGIEERHFERIFKMFQTLAPKDKTDSTGVGLALVKRIVERAGGQVWVESRLGGGSTFHFTWPKEPQAGSFSRIAE